MTDSITQIDGETYEKAVSHKKGVASAMSSATQWSDLLFWSCLSYLFSLFLYSACPTYYVPDNLPPIPERMGIDLET